MIYGQFVGEFCNEIPMLFKYVEFEHEWSL